VASKIKMDRTGQQILILIVDNQTVVRQALRLLIEGKSNMRVVGEAGNRDEALALANAKQPDIILLELDLGGSSGLDFLPELIASAQGARVLVLTGMRDPEIHRRAVRLGATGLVLKEQASDILLRAIEKVHAGEAWLDHRMTASVIVEFSRRHKVDQEAAKIASLTEREHEIVSVVSEGLKSKQIAEKLFISQATVRNHLTSILGKLGVSDRFELALYAYRHSLAQPPRAQAH
jgi:two-component system, NarL family, nitrate/nitrite response regulator NarL